jgi:hypothetical protein
LGVQDKLIVYLQLPIPNLWAGLKEYFIQVKDVIPHLFILFTEKSKRKFCSTDPPLYNSSMLPGDSEKPPDQPKADKFSEYSNATVTNWM